MPTPFPGMDPYLERPSLWPNVHTSLIIAIRDDLVPRLPEQYYISVEERTYQVGPEDLALAQRPDVALVRPTRPQEPLTPTPSNGVSVLTVELPMPDTLREIYLEIREVATDYVVTVFEILSPTNKQPGPHRRDYEHKRLTLLGTLTHLVEVDLLRAGPPMPMFGSSQTDYRILISRAERRPSAELLVFNVQQPIPSFRVPLRSGDVEPELTLNHVLHALYDRAGYSRRVDYRASATPPLTGQADAWANELLQAAGLRSKA